MEIANSRFVTDIGGIVSVSGHATASIRDSSVGGLGLTLQATDVLRATDLGTGWFDDLDLQRDWTGSHLGFNLRLANVELIPDTIGEGPYERGWVVFTDERAAVEIGNSTLRKLVVDFPAAGGEITASGLRLNTPTEFRFGDAGRIGNVTVTGQWGFFIHGARRATFDDCHALWFFLYDTVEVLLRRSVMNEFDPRNYRGTVTFEDGAWIMAGEIIENNDCIMAGTYSTDDGVQNSLSWSQSVVTRRYPIRAPDHPNMTITLSRGAETVVATTDGEGNAMVDLVFSDADYDQRWRLTTSAGHGRYVDFFSTTPLVLR